MNVPVRIEHLCVYPVKSLAGIEVTSSLATQSGLEHDRQWAIIKPNGHILSQRKAPELALIQPRIQNNRIYLSSKVPGSNMGEIELTVDTEQPPFSIPVWQDHCPGMQASTQANQWLTEALTSKDPLRLVSTQSGSIRTANNPDRFKADINTYADAAPYLIGNIESLNHLNQTLAEQGKQAVDTRHFRANIWISGIPGFSEHHYTKLSPSQLTGQTEQYFELVDHCGRCVIITINPDSGEKREKNEPFKELAQLNAMPEQSKAPAFGVNSVLRGDTVELTAGQALQLS